jgi:hypothetical protein
MNHSSEDAIRIRSHPNSNLCSTVWYGTHTVGQARLQQSCDVRTREMGGFWIVACVFLIWWSNVLTHR